MHHNQQLPFKDNRITVVGDVMLDRYLWGNVRRISPEAPVPVVQLNRTTQTLGGAANVALNLASLGCRVAMIGVCGDDDSAQQLQQLLSQNGIDDHLIVDSSRPTITKTRIMAQRQQVMRVDEENTDPCKSAILDKVLLELEKTTGGCKAVIISDYGKGMFELGRLAQQIIDAGRRSAIPVLVDPKGTKWTKYHRATGITPNTAELSAVAGQDLEYNENALIEAAQRTLEQLEVDWLLVTRGPQGMSLIKSGTLPVLIKAQAREVFDVSGAGDTVIATMAAALAGGMNVVTAAHTANIAAGIVVGKLGTQPVHASELSTALYYNEGKRFYPYSAAKMTTLDAASHKVRDWKNTGLRIVFTNGCFDLLHPGHISLLYQARAMGDRLVVGLNTDASIRRLKGHGRPILSEQDRAAMLSALECVDMVVDFDDDTPIELIKVIRPDILVKGSDYMASEVVGADIVTSYGGAVKLVELVQGYSTTQLTRKVVDGFRCGEETQPRDSTCNPM